MPTAKIDLGWVGERPLRTEDRCGQALHLPDTNMLVIIERPGVAGRWEARRVLYGEQGDRGPRQMILTGDDLARAVDTIDIDITSLLFDDESHRALYLALWLLRIRQKSPGGRDADFARIIVVERLPPGILTVVLDEAARKRLCNAAHITDFVYHRIMERLVAGRFLTHLATEGPDRYLITIPESTPEEGNGV